MTALRLARQVTELSVDGGRGGGFGEDRDNLQAEREIEEHFARCLNALAARQEELLRALQQHFTLQSMFFYSFAKLFN